MRKNKNLLAVGVVLIVCFIAVCFSTSIQGGEKIFKIEPEITLPEYRTDTARAIDAYERLIDRFMSLTERNLAGINTDVKDIAKKLDSIDSKLQEISVRTEKIEKALGIEKSAPDIEQETQTEIPSTQEQKIPSGK